MCFCGEFHDLLHFMFIPNMSFVELSFNVFMYFPDLLLYIYFVKLNKLQHQIWLRSPSVDIEKCELIVTSQNYSLNVPFNNNLPFPTGDIVLCARM